MVLEVDPKSLPVMDVVVYAMTRGKLALDITPLSPVAVTTMV